MTKKDKKIKSEDSNIELIKKELKKTKGGFDFSACESKNLNEFFTYYEKDKNKIPFDKNTIINITVLIFNFLHAIQIPTVVGHFVKHVL